MENYEKIVFQYGDFELLVRLDKENNTVWLTQKDLSMLFEKPISTISYYLNKKLDNVWKKGGTYSKNLGKRSGHRPEKIYSFPVIKELGKYFKLSRFNAFLKEMKLYLNDNALSILDNEDIIYDNGTLKLSVKVSPKEQDVWLSQAQIASLYNTTRSNVTKHIQNIFDEGELAFSVSEDFSHTEIFSSSNIGPDSRV